MPINYKQYPPDWKSRIVPAVWKRAGDQCESCGLTHGQKVYSFKVAKKRGNKTIYRRLWVEVDPKLAQPKAKLVTVVLTVAHLDNDATNHAVEINRLKLLCQRCHLQADAQYKAMKRSCHYYCDWPKCQAVKCVVKAEPVSKSVPRSPLVYPMAASLTVQQNPEK